MSVIETPPKDRLAIQTVVAHFDAELVRTAIEQELSRGGQVYFVHNRIDSIFTRAAWIQELVPQARIGVGHGQMDEKELERVLLGFMRHEYDVFVSTTIVENGLDIPLANTMIIDHAERHGLSELYQLPGPRGTLQSAGVCVSSAGSSGDTELSEIARKRLAALREFSDLGAGFKIAALDLELRGAGNLLGGEQHGHIAAVGFDTYVRLLEETARELKGEEAPLEVHSSRIWGWTSASRPATSPTSTSGCARTSASPTFRTPRKPRPCGGIWRIATARCRTPSRRYCGLPCSRAMRNESGWKRSTAGAGR